MVPISWATRLATVILLVPAAVAVWMAASLGHDIPWGDQLTLFRDTGLADGITLKNLFRFHNEHLIVPTRIVVAVDHWLWQGANLLPGIASLCCVLGTIAVEAWIFRRAVPEVTPGAGGFVTAALAAILLNGRLTWTLTFPILLQHVSANLCVTLAIAAFASLATGTTDRRGRAWTCCLAAAVVAATSSAAGVFALPSATAATLLLAGGSPGLQRRPWRGPALAGCVIGAGIVAAYALAHAAMTTGGRPPPDLVQAIRFAIYFPGGGWFRESTWPIVHRADPLLLHAVVLGFWLLLAVVAVRFWNRRATAGEFEVFHLGMLLFVVMTAAVGGLFRGGLGDLEAVNKKYAPTAMLAWASLGSLAMRDTAAWLFARGWIGGVRQVVVAGCLVAAILPGDRVEYRAWAAWRDELRSAIEAYAAGIRSDAVLLHFFPDADEADRLLAAIARDGSSWFRHRAGTATNAKLPAGGPPPAGGRLERIPDHTDYALEFLNDTREPLGKPPVQVARGGTLRIAGWAVDREAAGVPTAVELLVDGERYHCRCGIVREDVVDHFDEPGFATAGFECVLPPGRLAPGEHTLRLWIMLADGERYLETPAYRIVVE
jgi:hypothetical protein